MASPYMKRDAFTTKYRSWGWGGVGWGGVGWGGVGLRAGAPAGVAPRPVTLCALAQPRVPAAQRAGRNQSSPRAAAPHLERHAPEDGGDEGRDERLDHRVDKIRERHAAAGAAGGAERAGVVNPGPTAPAVRGRARRRTRRHPRPFQAAAGPRCCATHPTTTGVRRRRERRGGAHGEGRCIQVMGGAQLGSAPATWTHPACAAGQRAGNMDARCAAGGAPLRLPSSQARAPLPPPRRGRTCDRELDDRALQEELPEPFARGGDGLEPRGDALEAGARDAGADLAHARADLADARADLAGRGAGERARRGAARQMRRGAAAAPCSGAAPAHAGAAVRACAGGGSLCAPSTNAIAGGRADRLPSSVPRLGPAAPWSQSW
jgi:hypothetical protein